jgi:hypothetical protein
MAAIEIPDDSSDERREGQPLPIPPIGLPMPMSRPIVPQPAPTAMPAPPAMPTQAIAFPAIGATPQPAAPAMTVPTLPAPEKSGLQRLWDKTSDIQNPGIRALAKTGTGVLTGLEAVGSAAFPGIAAMISGSAMNTRIGNNRADKRAEEEQAMKVGQQKTDAETTTAEANKSKAQTDAAKEAREAAAPPKTGNTPEETTIHDLMTGNGGQPRINPQTGQPYSYLEAYQAVNQAKQDTKPDKPTKPTFQEQSYDEWHKTHPNGTRMQFEKETKEAERTPRQPTDREEWMEDHKGQNNPDTGKPYTIEDYWKAKAGAGASAKAQAGEEAGKAAQQYADDYLKSGKFTGAGDEALMEKYFELAKPSSGFRMTQPQIEMMRHAQDLMNSIVAKGKHLFTPEAPYFSDTQRQQIVDTMKNLQKARDEVKPGATKPGAAKGKGSFKEF